LSLTPDDIDAIERAIPFGAADGERYPEHSFRSIDSEKS